MPSQLVCGCGLRYPCKEGATGGTARCPVCGGALRVVTTARATRDGGSSVGDWIKIGVGVVSALGLIGLIALIAYQGQGGAGMKPRPVKPAPMPVATAPEAEKPAPPPPITTIDRLDRQMVPVGPIGGP